MLVNAVFDPKAFIRKQTNEIKKALGRNRALVACSGGVDSTVCAGLAHLAVGNNLVCIFIDTGFMRIGEPEAVIKTLSEEPLNLPIKPVRARYRFLNNMKGLGDAEEKRKAFRDTFYSILGETAKKEKCEILIQGTILPDIIETTKGIKTQHNILAQMKINPMKVYGFKVVEPLSTLYKFQVRDVAKALGMPVDASMRQPFPGPGLSVRVVGMISAEKLEAEKKATQIVEDKINLGMSKQYLAATIDDVKVNYSEASRVESELQALLDKESTVVKVFQLRDRATGIKKGERQYGNILLVEATKTDGKCLRLPNKVLDKVQKTVIGLDDSVSRVLYRISDLSRNGKWIISVRAVDTLDFVTAAVSDIPWKTLQETGSTIMDSCSDVTSVYYDVTPKPPSSIEFE
jgi:GMP synthase (glutamine-hydrolysing)